MTRDEALKLLRGGGKGFAQWIKRHAANEELPDLSRADLSGVDLRYAPLGGVNLCDSRLGTADLSRADLSGANLSGADLVKANLYAANLANADLSYANLARTNLARANLGAANLTGADLSAATLTNACLRSAYLEAATFRYFHADSRGLQMNGPTSNSGADFTGATFGFTTIDTHLNAVVGLDDTTHSTSSNLSFLTLFDFREALPTAFLRGCGLRDEEIEHFRVRIANPLRFYSCFISYSHTDKAFARRLHDTLQGRGIRCWLDEHQMLPGDKMHVVVNEAIRVWDKVLLCASEASLSSWWVDKEVTTALKKEERLWKERGNREVLALIPLNLDGYLFSDEWRAGWKEDIQSRLAADFTGWESGNAKFEVQVDKVVEALKTERPKPPAALL